MFRTFFYGFFLIFKLLAAALLYFVVYPGYLVSTGLLEFHYFPIVQNYLVRTYGDQTWEFFALLGGALLFAAVMAGVVALIAAPLIAFLKWSFRPEYEAVTEAANEFYHDATN